jgi:hypothetical protein
MVCSAVVLTPRLSQDPVEIGGAHIHHDEVEIVWLRVYPGVALTKEPGEVAYTCCREEDAGRVRE